MSVLLGRLFTIKLVETIVLQHYRVILNINSSHPIFVGHFPGHPVLPGVCTLRIVTECAEHILGYPLMMFEASQIKYLGVVQPKAEEELLLDMMLDQSDDSILLKAKMHSDERQILSCKLKLSAKSIKYS